LVKLPVQLCSALVEKRVGTQTKDMVVSVVGMAIRGGTEGASEKRPAFERGGGFLGGAVPHCPVPLVEKLFVVAAGALRKTREVEDFGGKTHGHVFPDGGVQALRTVLISVSLCLYPAEALDPLF